MPIQNVNNTKIAYERYGDISHPTIVLVHGLSTPLTGWPIEMIDLIVSNNMSVLLLDNRDVGQSQLFEQQITPNLFWTALKIKCGLSPKIPYQLTDMANDLIALVDHLGIDKFHIVGASMGGMISQLVAIHYPKRVLSLTSIMSTTGNRKLPLPNIEIQKKLFKKPASSSGDDKLALYIEKWRTIQSPDYPASELYLENYVRGLLNRGITFKGMLRQMLAIISAKDRTKLLASLTMPTLIMHGDKDLLVDVKCGIATADAIPHARLKIYPGMGHDLPVELLPSFVEEIVKQVNLTDR